MTFLVSLVLQYMMMNDNFDFYIIRYFQQLIPVIIMIINKTVRPINYFIVKGEVKQIGGLTIFQFYLLAV